MSQLKIILVFAEKRGIKCEAHTTDPSAPRCDVISSHKYTDGRGHIYLCSFCAPAVHDNMTGTYRCMDREAN